MQMWWLDACGVRDKVCIGTVQIPELVTGHSTLS